MFCPTFSPRKLSGKHAQFLRVSLTGITYGRACRAAHALLSGNKQGKHCPLTAPGSLVGKPRLFLYDPRDPIPLGDPPGPHSVHW